MAQVKAYAKLNLFLHVTGKRANGYHELESAIVFTDLADHLIFTPSQQLTLAVKGPYGDKIVGHDNIVLRAAHALQAYGKQPVKGVAITLEKYIPVGAGLGGGSSDAAATLTTLNQYWELNLSDGALREISLTLGADVPVCVYGKPAWVTGVGEIITPLSAHVSSMHVVLVNPGIELATPKVFQALVPSQWSGSVRQKERDDLIGNIGKLNNDLEIVSKAIVPDVGVVIKALEAQKGCNLARMSGSGATCFGWFNNQAATKDAVSNIAQQYPQWWVQPATIQ